MTRTACNRRAAGFTLIEIMVAMALGLLLTGSLLSVFISSKRNYSDNERIARIQSNGRAALYLLANDLRHINFWGSLVDIGNAGTFPSAALTGTCAGWAAGSDATQNLLVGSDDPRNHTVFTASGCLSAGEIAPATSAVGIKRVSRGPVAFSDLATGEVFLRMHSEAGNFRVKGSGNGALAPDPAWQDWRYQPRLYFIRNYWQTVGDGVPALCAVQVDGAAPDTLATRCLIEGVEALHIEYGIDTSDPTDGVPDEYTAAPTADQALAAVAVRLHLLVRDTDADGGYSNTDTYQLGGRTVSVNDNYRRALFGTTVVLHNQRNLPIQ